MNIETLSLQDIEQDRQMQASELSAEAGKDWENEYRPGTAGCHELLDRAALVIDLLERHVLAHPACIARPDWYLLAEQATSALRELYQQIGVEHLAADKSDGGLDGKDKGLGAGTVVS